LLIVQLDYGWNRSRSAYHFTPADAPRLAAWRSFGGRNTIVVDASDHGTPAATARKYLGDCPIVAATHAVSVRTMRPSVDISLPLPPREPCCEGLHALSASLWMLDGAARRYWVTFRGTTYFGGEGKRRDELLALDGQREPHDGGRVAVVRLGCHKLHGEHLLLANRHRCERLEASLRTAPSFVELLNATFALLPAGRQPATLRLNEAMAAATIPIFVAGDARAPYVPPYSQLIDWHTIALNVGWSELPRLPRMLSSLTPAKVAAMQQGVRRAWLRHLRPDTGATQRAFYAIATHAFTSRLQPGGWSNVSMRTHLVRAMLQ